MSQSANPFKASIFSASREPLTIAVLVLPYASILEVASVLDPMRAANRHLGAEEQIVIRKEALRILLKQNWYHLFENQVAIASTKKSGAA